MFLTLVKRQQVEGFWVLNEENRKLIDENENDILIKSPQQLQNINLQIRNNIWFTSLVLKWIEHYFPKDKDSLHLIFKKALQWVNKNGVDYKKIKAEAEAYFNFS